MSDRSKADRDNHANQLNPNNPAYWTSRGVPSVPAGGTPPAATPAPAPSQQPASTGPKQK